MNIRLLNIQSSIKTYIKITIIFKLKSIRDPYRLEKDYFPVLLSDKSIRIILHLNNLTVHIICGW